MKDNLYLPMINLTPTMRCNLKCKLCGVLVPHYKYRPEMSITELEKTLKGVFEIVDKVGNLQITGGEPLLHPCLPEVIETCFKYTEQFEKLWIFTNASVRMTTRFIKVLEKHKGKILVHISDYGIKPDVSAELVLTLKEIGCEYKYLKYFGDNQYFDGWVDQGDFVPHNRSQDELINVFSKCPHVTRGGSWYVRNGQMHWCGRAIRAIELDKIPQQEEDYLDIFTGTIEERRNKLIRLKQNKYILACDYCNGNYGADDINQRYPAGEQM